MACTFLILTFVVVMYHPNDGNIYRLQRASPDITSVVKRDDKT